MPPQQSKRAKYTSQLPQAISRTYVGTLAILSVKFECLETMTVKLSMLKYRCPAFPLGRQRRSRPVPSRPEGFIQRYSTS